MPLPDVTLGGSSSRPPMPELTSEPGDVAGEDAEEHTSLVPTQPAGALNGARLSAAERVWLVVCHVGREIAAQARFVFSHADGVGAMQPESWADYDAYREGRGWLPEGQRGGPLEMVPAVYYATVGKLGFIFDGAAVGLRGCGWVFKRMLRFCVAALVLLLIVSFWFFN